MADRIAVLSDIHANRMALEAVLDDIALQHADLIINLGDTLFGPLEPVETARLLRQAPRMVHIMGNCDEALLTENPDSMTYRFVKPLLDEPTTEWIATFQPEWSCEDLYFCHGSPGSNRTYLMQEVTQDGAVAKSPEALASLTARLPYSHIFCGHSHVPATVRLPNGQSVHNPGSVGLPAYREDLPYPHRMEAGSPFARYTLITRTSSRSKWHIEPVQVRYDWDAAADLALRNGRPDYAVAIRTGYAGA